MTKTRTKIQNRGVKKMSIKIFCTRCEYTWDYKGENRSTENVKVYVTCPKCRKNLRIPVV